MVLEHQIGNPLSARPIASIIMVLHTTLRMEAMSGLEIFSWDMILIRALCRKQGSRAFDCMQMFRTSKHGSIRKDTLQNMVEVLQDLDLTKQAELFQESLRLD